MCEIIFYFFVPSLKILCEAETHGRLEMGGVAIGGAPPPLDFKIFVKKGQERRKI